MKIIYETDSGMIAIITPSPDWAPSDVARKDVPFGTPFLIVKDIDLPSDWSTSVAWEADFSNPDGYGLGAQRWFIQQAAAVISNPDSTPEQIEEAMQLSEQMQREIIQLEGAPM